MQSSLQLVPTGDRSGSQEEEERNEIIDSVDIDGMNFTFHASSSSSASSLHTSSGHSVAHSQLSQDPSMRVRSRSHSSSLSTDTQSKSESSEHPGVLSQQDTPYDQPVDIVPKDAHGRPTSMGSIQHATGKCTPCLYHHRRVTGCINGLNCSYCHFDHSFAKPKTRPCKDKRARVSKNLRIIEQRIEDEIDHRREDLNIWILDLMELLPPSANADPQFQHKMWLHITQYAENLLAKRQFAASHSEAAALPAASHNNMEEPADEWRKSDKSINKRNKSHASTKLSL